MTTRQPSERRRVAVLGGGVAGLTTALALTDPDNPKHDQYDVTVYQMGWRLGGKGASGRNMDPAYHYRIEEHGLHIWFGCYDNAFRLIQKCYKELDRPPDAPLASWRDAFKPHSAAVIEEQVGKKWYSWLGAFPTNKAVPGEGGLLPPWEYVRIAIEWFYRLFFRSRHGSPSPTGDEDIHLPGPGGRRLQSWASAIEIALVRLFVRLVRRVHLLALALGLSAKLMVGVFGVLLRWHWRKIRDKVDSHLGERRLWIILHIMYATFRGIVRDKVLERGFASLNGQDFREWLAKHALDDGGLMINSYFLIGVYDGMFAYENGDNRMPPGAKWPPGAKMEAGEALKTGMRQYLTYKGASIWKMQAGMGDTIFGPVYSVLKRRGVRFKFFHRIDRIVASADGKRVERIDVTRQATVKPEQEARGGYQPLFDVKGLPCWPSTPLYDQLVEGDELRTKKIDLESYASGWDGVEKISLNVGAEFDDVVLGISIGALPYVACDLIEKSTKWQVMVRHVRTTRTMGSQLWLKPTAYQLGWTKMQRPILSGFEVTQLDTWADMSHLIEREDWHVGAPPDSDANYPLNIAYFTGPMLDEKPLELSACGPVERFEPNTQRDENSKVFKETRKLLDHYIGDLFPKAVTGDGHPRWELLVDDRSGEHHGEDRLKAQYFRANVQPSERYVLSLPGSNKYRLPARDEGEFTNLYLSGDWTDCGFNVGCVEAATMSGLLAANALSGYPRRADIVGLDW